MVVLSNLTKLTRFSVWAMLSLINRVILVNSTMKTLCHIEIMLKGRQWNVSIEVDIEEKAVVSTEYSNNRKVEGKVNWVKSFGYWAHIQCETVSEVTSTVFCKTYCISRKVRFESLNFFALRNMARTFALVRNGTYLVKVEAVTNH